MFGLSFRLTLGFAVYVSLRGRIVLYSPYFLPEMMVKFTRKARRHFVSLIESGIRLVECISGHNSSKPVGNHCLLGFILVLVFCEVRLSP